MPINYDIIPSPCFVLDEQRLRNNLTLINKVREEANIDIILAFKGFAMWGAFPIVKEYLGGTSASSLNEVKLSIKHFGQPPHTYAPVYPAHEFEEIAQSSSHLTFNSISQFEKYRSILGKLNKRPSIGLRINPGYSDVTTDLYNPASPTSRLGLAPEHLPYQLPEEVEGLHFHVLCESDSKALEKVLQAVEGKFGQYLSQIKWINMGGGHLMTRKGYDVEHLIQLLKGFKKKHQIDIILEPGSAIAWETGELVATVEDIIENGGVKTAMLNVSFTAHMPDTLEMPYKPKLLGANETPQKDDYQYRLGGNSCLAGDYMSAYGFPKPLHPGDRIILIDMMHYTMVKTTFFNGVNHPSIGIWKTNNEFKLVRKFGFEDYEGKLS